jgi:hypothetical protein
MSEFSPLENDVWLKGTLVIQAIGRSDRQPQPGKRVLVKACGYN